MTVNANLPDLHPSLVLDFANSRGVDPRIKFSRASTATYFDEFGVMQTAPVGVPRIDYDPATGKCRGLLVEEQRTNLLKYSEQFDNTSSHTPYQAVVVPNSTTAPDTTATADKIIAANTNGSHSVSTPVSVMSGKSYTNSCFFKGGEFGFGTLGFSSAGGSFANAFISIDLQTGSIVPFGSPSDYGAKYVGNGWWRAWITATALLSAEGYPYRGLSMNPDTVAFTGDGISGIYIWGAQLEEGSFPTSYIPSSVTFTGRASAGTYIGSDGLIKTAASGEARYQYNPLNLKLAPKLLLEEQRTNAVLNGVAHCAGDHTSASAGIVVGPDGQLATKVIPTAGPVSYAGSGNPYVQTFANSTTAGQATYYSFSGYFAGFGPKNYQPYIVITAGSNPGNELYAVVRFDTATGLFTGHSFNTGFSSLSAPKAVMMPSGMWYVTWTVRYIQQTLLRSNVTTYIQIHNENNTGIYTADGVSGIQRACLQFEEGPYPTSYIKTEAAQVTRVADSSTSAQTTRSGEVASMTGSSFSDWYHQGEGTFMVDYRCDHIGGPFYPSAWYVRSDMSNRFGHSIPNVNKNVFYDSIIGGVTTVELGFANTKDDVKSAFAYKLNDVAVSTFGSSVLTDTSTPIPFVNRLEVGHRNNLAQLNGHIRRIAYYPRRITNEQLQALTTI